jgi:sphingomyelin phosphodiesterase 2
LLTARVRERYPQLWYQPGDLGGGGLLMLSRYPVIESRFEPYLLKGRPQRFDHADYYAGKGFLHLRLATDRGPVSVINTHLHAQYANDVGDGYLGVRTGQAVQLATAINELDEPLVVLGDFNFFEGKPVYRILSGLSGLGDTAAVLNNRLATVRRASPYRRGKKSPDSRKDYIFVRDGASAALRPVSVNRVFDWTFDIDGRIGGFSNHDGVSAELELVDNELGAHFVPEPSAIALARSLLQEGKRQAMRRRMMERGIGTATLAAGGVFVAGSFRRRCSRRRFLQRSMLALPVVGMPSGTGFLALSEFHGPAMLEAYDRLIELLKKTGAR